MLAEQLGASSQTGKQHGQVAAAGLAPGEGQGPCWHHVAGLVGGLVCEWVGGDFPPEAAW
jgi:hypothetical protein